MCETVPSCWHPSLWSKISLNAKDGHQIVSATYKQRQHNHGYPRHCSCIDGCTQGCRSIVVMGLHTTTRQEGITGQLSLGYALPATTVVVCTLTALLGQPDLSPLVLLAGLLVRLIAL
jgi:hypothetical protein